MFWGKKKRSKIFMWRESITAINIRGFDGVSDLGTFWKLGVIWERIEIVVAKRAE